MQQVVKIEIEHVLDGLTEPHGEFDGSAVNYEIEAYGLDNIGELDKAEAMERIIYDFQVFL